MNKQPANQWVFRGRIATWLLLYNADLARCMLRFCGWFEWLVLPLRLEHCSVQKVHHLSPLPLESTAQSPSWQALPSFTRTSVLSNWQCSHYWPASPFSGCLARTRWRCTIATFYGPLDSSTGGFQPRSPLIGLILNQPGPFQRVCSWCRINLLVNWCWTLYQQRGGSIIACERGLGRKEEARRSYLPHLTHAQQISCWCMPALQLYSAGEKKEKKKGSLDSYLLYSAPYVNSSPSSLASVLSVLSKLYASLTWMGSFFSCPIRKMPLTEANSDIWENCDAVHLSLTEHITETFDSAFITLCLFKLFNVSARSHICPSNKTVLG